MNSCARCWSAALLRYLAVAHFGRGRGGFVESEAPAFWQAEVEAEVARHDGQRCWRLGQCRVRHGSLAALLEQMTGAILHRLYPR